MNTSLGEFHHFEEPPPRSNKIVAWVILAVIAGGIGLYVVESGILTAAPSTTQTIPRIF
jgi:hypothetical protein